MSNAFNFLDKKLDYSNVEDLRIILKDKAKHILEKIKLLNQEYNNTNYRHEKASIGKEIDYLELQLKRIDDILIYEIGDNEAAITMINKQKKDITELEFLIQNNHLPKTNYIRLFNKKIAFNTILNELTFKKLYHIDWSNSLVKKEEKETVINDESINTKHDLVVKEINPEFVEVERLIPVPTVQEKIVYRDSEPIVVEKVVEVEIPQLIENQVHVKSEPEIVEIEKLVNIAGEQEQKIVEIEKLVNIAGEQEQKIVEVEKLVNIESPHNQEIVEVEKLVNIGGEEIQKVVEVEVPVAHDVEKIVEVNQLIDVPYYQPEEPVYYGDMNYYNEEPMYYDDQGYYAQDYSMYDNYDQYYDDQQYEEPYYEEPYYDENQKPIVEVENREVVYNLREDKDTEEEEKSTSSDKDIDNDYFDDDDEFDEMFE